MFVAAAMTGFASPAGAVEQPPADTPAEAPVEAPAEDPVEAPAPAPDPELTMTGNAYVMSVLGSGALAPASIPGSPDTGYVESTAAGDYQAPCGVDLPPTMVEGRGLCAKVTTGAVADTSVATASADEVQLKPQGLPQITFTGVRAQSISQCAGAKGLTDIGELRIDNQVIPISSGPNFTTDLVGQLGARAKLIVNEQIQSADQLTVNAARLVITGGGMGSTDIVIASATSGVRNCPALVVAPVDAPASEQAPAPSPVKPPIEMTQPEVTLPEVSGLPGTGKAGH